MSFDFVPFGEIDGLAVAALVAVYFMAFFIRGIIGFGSAMPAVLGSAWILPPHDAVLIALLTSVFAQVQLLPQGFRDANWKITKPLIAGTILSVAIGVWIFASLKAAWLTIVLGLILSIAVLIDMARLTQRMAAVLQLDRFSVAFSLASIAGLMAGIAGAGSNYFPIGLHPLGRAGAAGLSGDQYRDIRRDDAVALLRHAVRRPADDQARCRIAAGDARRLRRRLGGPGHGRASVGGAVFRPVPLGFAGGGCGVDLEGRKRPRLRASIAPENLRRAVPAPYSSRINPDHRQSRRRIRCLDLPRRPPDGIRRRHHTSNQSFKRGARRRSDRPGPEPESVRKTKSVALNEAFFEHLLLCIRCDPLSAEDFAEFGRQFGTPQLQLLRKRRHGDVPEVSVLESTYSSADDKPNDMQMMRLSGWHTDDSYFAKPAKATMYQSLKIPESGGETRFCNMRQAYDDLSDDDEGPIGRAEDRAQL